MLTSSLFPPALAPASRAPYAGRRAARALATPLAVLVSAGLVLLPTGVAAAAATTTPPAGGSVGATSGAAGSTTGTPSPTTSHTPRPIVSPWAGPLTTPCPPVPQSTAGPAVTDAPSAVPTVLTTDPVGGPLLGSTGLVVHPAAGVPSAPDISASSWVIADADTGEILAAKDPHGKFLPASTLKTLTAVTLIPRLDPCGVYTATKDDLHAECTCVGVADGQAYRIKMLFTAMLIYSGNDAADTLAGAYGGIPKTVAAMNAEAAYLKAYDTNAGTPSGLDTPGEHSSAYDLALIARAGLAMPDFKSYVSTRHVLFPLPKGKTQTLFTHVKLLPNYDGAIGVKNGFTVAAQATYIGAATRGGHTLIATLMHSTVGTAVWHEDAALLDWGFKAVGKVTPVGQLVSPDLPPAPSTAAAVATTSTSAAAATTSSAVPTTVLTKEVEASATRKSSAGSGTSVLLPVSVAVVLVVAAAAVFAVLARRRRRTAQVSERTLRF